MNRISDKTSQLVKWLNNIFPPNSPRVTQPNTLEEVIRLTMPALPPSLIVERVRLTHCVSDVAATSMFWPGNIATGAPYEFGSSGAGPGPGVGLGDAKNARQFAWIHGVDFYVNNAIISVPGNSFTRIRPSTAAMVALGAGITMGAGIFEAGDILARVFTHAFFINTGFPGVLAGSPGGYIAGGGGPGGFFVPNGWEIHFSTAGTPAAAGRLNADIMWSILEYGELVPPVA